MEGNLYSINEDKITNQMRGHEVYLQTLIIGKKMDHAKSKLS